jgi:iron(III) transport system permease protein
MISSLVLERPGVWRAAGVTAILLAAILPFTPLLWLTAASTDTFTASLGTGFGRALVNSAAVALAVAAASLGSGLPAGVLAALYEYRGRRLLLALAVLPLLVPSFLWAVGWSSLAVRLGPAASAVLSGHAGCVLVFFSSAFPLVLLTSAAATASLSGSVVDAARLAGGEGAVVRYACRHAAVPACLAAVLAGVLTLSDPGPGQILGLHTAAAEGLISFSALYDFGLAGRQCIALALVVLAVTAPLACLAAPRLATEMMARQFRRPQRTPHRGLASAAGAGLTLVLLAEMAAPVLGLIFPLLGRTDFARAWREVERTGVDTLVYAGGAGVTAAALGFGLAFFVGRSSGLRTARLGLCLVLFSMPPALAALGVVGAAAQAPAWADPVLRSRLSVCLVLGIRFFPLAAVLGLRSWGSTPASLALAAGVHGVPLRTFLRRVTAPLQLPAAAMSLLLVGLLATADVGTVLLLHPPGEASFPLALFTVMANAPASLVASLCAVYLAAAAGLLMAAWALVRGGTA